ncbi:hypothetical protein CBR_g8494 [Chara braunii]|uniref:Uncharacterized protein n=1 Tax=Chara braunii TaxID=69332 RepID=A0A388KMB7_CHABU|nr:hypothetical protein CBR_g8494 [Chara braunii]|eukprot:GBG71191.1 hypothetical protein CBR_g8494 [Chara braunii]
MRLEPLSDYLQRVQAFTDVVATAKAQQEAAEAERQRLADEAAAQARRTTEVDATARDRWNAASAESLIQNENQWTMLLQGMIFVHTDVQADPTPVEAESSNLANLMLGMMRAQQQQHQLLNCILTRVNSIEAQASAVPGCMTDTTKQLGERIDHVVNLIGELGDFTSLATISSTVAAIKTDITKLQSRPDAATKAYKMPRFNIDKFDDYNKTDALTWWQGFLTEASCHSVSAENMMKALYLQPIGGAQAWMNHTASNLKCTITQLHTHILWNQFEQMWFTRFMVRNVVKAAMNDVYSSSQGNMPTRDWTIKWQKIVTTLGFDFSFPNQRSEFFSRSCAGLRTALNNEYDYASFQAIMDRANLVIQTDDKAANERQSQPHYVAKQGYQRPTHNNAVVPSEPIDLHAAAASSGDGGVVATLPPKRTKRVQKNKATQTTTSTGTGQQPWTAYNITKEATLKRRMLRGKEGNDGGRPYKEVAPRRDDKIRGWRRYDSPEGIQGGGGDGRRDNPGGGGRRDEDGTFGPGGGRGRSVEGAETEGDGERERRRRREVVGPSCRMAASEGMAGFNADPPRKIGDACAGGASWGSGADASSSFDVDRAFDSSSLIARRGLCDPGRRPTVPRRSPDEPFRTRRNRSYLAQGRLGPTSTKP